MQHATRFCGGCGGGAGAIILNFQGIARGFYRVLRQQLRVVLPDLILLIKLLSENEGFTTDIVILPMAYNRISD